ncbi:MAG: hypothetical protein ACRCTI_17210, partial [Beijerinckiaceae bacterium]
MLFFSREVLLALVQAEAAILAFRQRLSRGCRGIFIKWSTSPEMGGRGWREHRRLRRAFDPQEAV